MRWWVGVRSDQAASRSSQPGCWASTGADGLRVTADACRAVGRLPLRVLSWVVKVFMATPIVCADGARTFG